MRGLDNPEPDKGRVQRGFQSDVRGMDAHMAKPRKAASEVSRKIYAAEGSGVGARDRRIPEDGEDTTVKYAAGGKVSSRQRDFGFMREKVGNRDTKHGMLDLPVATEAKMKKPRIRFAEGGLTFAQAFRNARNKQALEGADLDSGTFEWNGKKFNTQMAKAARTKDYGDEVSRLKARVPSKDYGDEVSRLKARVPSAPPEDRVARVRALNKEGTVTRYTPDRANSPANPDIPDQVEMYKRGGSVRSRDGIAQRGKTKGAMR